MCRKIRVYEFKKDIKFKGDSYTVFVKQEEENFMIDIFMEKVKGRELLSSNRLRIYEGNDVSLAFGGLN